MFNAFDENGNVKKIDRIGDEGENEDFNFFMYTNDEMPCDFYIYPTFGGRPIMAEIPFGFDEYLVHYGDKKELANDDEKFRETAEESGLLEFFDKVRDHFGEIYKGFRGGNEKLFLYGEYREDDGLIRFHSAAFSFQDEPFDASEWSLRFGEVAKRIGDRLGKFIVLPELFDAMEWESESESDFCGDVMRMIDDGCFRYNEDKVTGIHVWCIFQCDGDVYGDWWFPMSYIAENSDRIEEVNRYDLTKWSINDEQ